MSRNTSFLLFLLAALSQTQVRLVGSIGISEAVVFIIAPMVYIQDRMLLRKHGFTMVLNLALLSCVGCVLSSWYNHTIFANALRGFATCYSLFAMPVVLHRLLWRNLNGFRWFLVGFAVSGLLTLFGMQTGVESAIAERLEGGASESDLYFGRHFGPWFSLPLKAFYFQTPTPVALLLSLVPSIYMITTSATGRSALLTVLGGAMLVIFVHRKRSQMVKMQKHILFFAALGFIIALSLGTAYKVASKKGWLNEKAQAKYESQAKDEKGGLLKLLMHGRSEFFIAVYACCDEPIFGFGPWPVDRKGIVEEFLRKYGDAEAYEDYIERKMYLAQRGVVGNLIPGHSHIMTNWLCYGILGLPFWLYVLYLMVELFRKHLAAIPQWFGYFAVELTGMLWHVFFSPFSGRVQTSFFITCVLLAIAVGRGKIMLPPKMMMEAGKYDR